MSNCVGPQQVTHTHTFDLPLHQIGIIVLSRQQRLAAMRTGTVQVRTLDLRWNSANLAFVLSHKVERGSV